MNDVLDLVLPPAAGVLIGALFFGGLWWTVQKGVSSRQPALWFLGSVVIRMIVALAGFYVVGRGRWDRLLLCLIGFLLARLLVARFARRAEARETHHSPEASHAA
jgi:F1F0 ATPase subunit 2